MLYIVVVVVTWSAKVVYVVIAHNAKCLVDGLHSLHLCVCVCVCVFLLCNDDIEKKI